MQRSVFIAGVREEVDTNTQPPGLVGVSIVVYNEGREVKFTAPTYERHDTWMNVSPRGLIADLRHDADVTVVV